MDAKINKLRIEINSHITAGLGVLLKWKNNCVYKFHHHHKQLDGEDALAVLMAENVTITQFIKALDSKCTSTIKDSNRDKGAKVVYVSNILKLK